MALDDRMRRASAELRRGVAGRGREPIAVVGKRAGMQRSLAFAGGAVVVVLAVGGVALASGGGATELSPVANTTTTSVEPPSTTTTATASAPDLETTSTTTEPTDDGRSDRTGIPDGWPSDLPADGHILLMSQGVGIAAWPSSPQGSVDTLGFVFHPGSDGSPEDPGAKAWEFGLYPGSEPVAIWRFGTDYEPEQGIRLFMELVSKEDDPNVTVYGFAPLGTTRIDLGVGDAGDADRIVIDKVFQRPEADIAVFVGSIAVSRLVSTEPVAFDVWLSTDRVADAVDVDLSSFAFLGGRVSNWYSGPLDTEMFVVPPELVVGTAEVESFPAVYECEGGARADVAPNKIREIADGPAFPSPAAALQALLDGEPLDSRPTSGGYTRFTNAAGEIAFGIRFGDDLDSVLSLVELAAVDGGWTVTRWEVCGC